MTDFLCLLYLSAIVYLVSLLAAEYASGKIRKILVYVKKLFFRKEVFVMKKYEIGRIHIFVAIYVFLIIIELFFYVPYHSIQVFKTNQNVPHTEIIGSGYSTMNNIAQENAFLKGNERTKLGKKANTSQIFVNISVTTIIFIAIYLIFLKDEKAKIVKDKTKSETKKTNIDDISILKDFKHFPDIDINGLAFADDETQEKAKRKYAVDMYMYIKNNSTPISFNKANKATEAEAEEQLSLEDALLATPPYLDVNDLAFADEETARQIQEQYTEDLYAYIKNRLERGQESI